VLSFRIPLTKDECIVEEDDLAINILDKNKECFGTTMYLLLLAEIGDNGQVNTKEGANDKLYLRLQSGKFS
jgi:putative Ca2+/H+ antiporter (TMEM165/GDT1 family)